MNSFQEFALKTGNIKRPRAQPNLARRSLQGMHPFGCLRPCWTKRIVFSAEYTSSKPNAFRIAGAMLPRGEGRRL